MPIPDFADAGGLPPGRHAASIDEVRERLVDAFPSSRTRSGIFTYWLHHREALADIVEVAFQWLAGSFTSDKPDPADADLVTAIDGPAFDALPTHHQLVVRALMAGHYTESFWRCDAYPVLAYPPEHPAHSKYRIALERLEDYFGHDRDGGARGMIEVGEAAVSWDDEDMGEGDAADGASGAPSAGPGIENLHRQLAELEGALDAYRDPVVEEHAGLRLMQETLEERAAHIRETIAAAETTTLEVRLGGAPAEHGSIALPLVLPALAALDEAVAALTGGDHLHLRQAEETAEGVRIVLGREPGRLDAQAVGPDGALAIDRALTAVLDLLDGTAPGDGARDGAVGAALGRFAAAVAAQPVTVGLDLAAATLPARRVDLDRGALQRLAT